MRIVLRYIPTQIIKSTWALKGYLNYSTCTCWLSSPVLAMHVEYTISTSISYSALTHSTASKPLCEQTIADDFAQLSIPNSLALVV